MGPYQQTLEQLVQGLDEERRRFHPWIREWIGDIDVRTFLQMHTVMNLGLVWDRGRPVYMKRDRWQTLIEPIIAYVEGDYEHCHQERTQEVEEILKKLAVFEPEFLAETIFIPGLQIRFVEPRNPIYEGPVQIQNFDEDGRWALTIGDVKEGLVDAVNAYLESIPVKDLSLAGRLKQLI